MLCSVVFPFGELAGFSKTERAVCYLNLNIEPQFPQGIFVKFVSRNPTIVILFGKTFENSEKKGKAPHPMERVQGFAAFRKEGQRIGGRFSDSIKWHGIP